MTRSFLTVRMGATVTHVHCKDTVAMWVTHLIAATRFYADEQGQFPRMPLATTSLKNRQAQDRRDLRQHPRPQDLCSTPPRASTPTYRGIFRCMPLATNEMTEHILTTCTD